MLEQVRREIFHLDACVCEPVVFEMMLGARRDERRKLEREFAVVPLLVTPPGLWSQAAQLSQQCRDRGFTIGALDLLIATVALHHDAEIITFDGDFSLIAQAEPKLRVQALARAA